MEPVMMIPILFLLAILFGVLFFHVRKNAYRMKFCSINNIDGQYSNSYYYIEQKNIFGFWVEWGKNAYRMKYSHYTKLEHATTVLHRLQSGYKEVNEHVVRTNTRLDHKMIELYKLKKIVQEGKSMLILNAGSEDPEISAMAKILIKLK